MRAVYSPAVNQAAIAVQMGGVIAYPTEAVWGLGCDPWDGHAVEHILRLKRRPVEKGLILIGSRMAHFEFLLSDLTAAQRQSLEQTWPGPHTWLVPHKNLVPSFVTGRHETVAIRVTAHPVAAALCERLGGPLVSTSANPQGCAPARFGYRARLYFKNNVVYAPGQVDLHASPSTIQDLATGRIIRA